eukprot:3201322-Rhodomonas_salina.1
MGGPGNSLHQAMFRQQACRGSGGASRGIQKAGQAPIRGGSKPKGSKKNISLPIKLTSSILRAEKADEIIQLVDPVFYNW